MTAAVCPRDRVCVAGLRWADEQGRAGVRGRPSGGASVASEHAWQCAVRRHQQAALLLQLLLPFLASGLEWAVEALTSSPAVAAIALCCLSMVQVSALGGLTLLMGVLALLLPARWGAIARDGPAPERARSGGTH